MSYVILPMEPRHVPEAAQLETVCFSEPWSERLLTGALEDPNAHFFAAEDASGQLLGYAGLHDIVGEGYVDNIAVFPQCRRQGIGEALTAALIGWAKKKELSLLTLEVRAGNQPAIALYRKLGLREEGRRKNFYRHPTEDALIMTLRL